MLTETQIQAIAEGLKTKLTALFEADDVLAARVDLWRFAELLQDLAANAGASYVSRLTVHDDGYPWLEGTGAYIKQGTDAFRDEVAARRAADRQRLIPHLPTDPAEYAHPSQDTPLKFTSVAVTPDIARDWLKLDWKEPEFFSNSPVPQVCFDEEGRLVDGQRGLKAIIEAGIEMTMFVCVGLPIAARDAMADFAKAN